MNWLPSLFEETVEQKNKREMLLSMNSRRGRREIFQGADAAKREKNRRKNKAARKARRASR